MLEKFFLSDKVGCLQVLIFVHCLLNDAQKGKTKFYSMQYRNGLLTASEIFHMFTQSIKFYYTFHYHVLRVQMFEKCYSSNRQ